MLQRGNCAEPGAELNALFKFAPRDRLFLANAAGDDIGFEIVLAEDGRAGEAAEHGNLADVREGVGDRALEEASQSAIKWLSRSKTVVEFFYGAVEAVDFGVPRERHGVVPGLLALRDGESPIEQIAHVGEDLRRSARLVADVEAGEVVGRAAEGFAGTVGDSGDGVAEELAVGVGRCGHGVVPFSIECGNKEF